MLQADRRQLEKESKEKKINASKYAVGLVRVELKISTFDSLQSHGYIDIDE